VFVRTDDYDVALGQPAITSVTGQNASLAVEGVPASRSSGSCTNMTAGSWWAVSLGRTITVGRVTIGYIYSKFPLQKSLSLILLQKVHLYKIYFVKGYIF